MTPVDALIAAIGPGRHVDAFAVVKELDVLEPDAAVDSLADVGTRHGVVMSVDRDQAARAHLPRYSNAIGQAAERSSPQLAFLLLPGLQAGRIASEKHSMQEAHVLLLGVEVATAAEAQRDVQLPEEMAMGAFHAAVLVRPPNIDRARLQPVMLQQLPKRRVEVALLALADPVRDRAAVVHLQCVRHAPRAVDGLAERGLEAREVLRFANRGPLPVGEREDRMAQQVREGHAANGHAQLVGVRPVDLQPFPRPMNLGKEHFLGNRTRTPGAKTPLHRPKLSVLVTPGIQELQPVQCHGRGQVRHHCQHVGQFVLNVRERVGTRAPSVRSGHFRRQLPQPDVLAGGGPTHACLQAAEADPAGCAMYLKEPFDLSIRNHALSSPPTVFAELRHHGTDLLPSRRAFGARCACACRRARFATDRMRQLQYLVQAVLEGDQVPGHKLRARSGKLFETHPGLQAHPPRRIPAHAMAVRHSPQEQVQRPRPRAQTAQVSVTHQTLIEPTEPRRDTPLTIRSQQHSC